MKFLHSLSFAVTTCLSIGIALAAPLHGDYKSDLQARNTPLPPLSLHLSQPSTFYRAVTGKERAVVPTNYVVGRHPATPKSESGDFSPDGAVYVFADYAEAVKWGNAFTNKPAETDFTWKLIKFKYTPKAGKNIKSFTSGTSEWKAFVEKGNTAGTKSTFDIIEGPVSVGRDKTRKPYHDGTSMLYQAAFRRGGLDTLVVESVTTMTVTGKGGWCNDCNIH